MKEVLDRKLKSFVGFIKLMSSEGFVKTVKADKENTKVLAGVCLVILCFFLFISGGEEEASTTTAPEKSIALTSNEALLESDSIGMDKPFGLFVYEGLVGQTEYLDLNDERLMSFGVSNGVRVGYFTAKIKKLTEELPASLYKTGMKDIIDAYSFEFTDPIQRAPYKAYIIQRENKGNPKYVLLRHLQGKGIRTSIVTNIKYLD